MKRFDNHLAAILEGQEPPRDWRMLAQLARYEIGKLIAERGEVFNSATPEEIRERGLPPQILRLERDILAEPGVMASKHEDSLRLEDRLRFATALNYGARTAADEQQPGSFSGADATHRRAQQAVRVGSVLQEFVTQAREMTELHRMPELQRISHWEPALHNAATKMAEARHHYGATNYPVTQTQHEPNNLPFPQYPVVVRFVTAELGTPLRPEINNVLQTVVQGNDRGVA
jgi:hypothetical protein